MNVRFVELAEPLREGGLEKAAADMAKYLQEAGVDVTREDHSPEEVAQADLVHFHGLWSPAHYRLARACRKAGKPFIVSPHGMLEPWAWRHRRWKKWPYFHLIEKRRLKDADCLLATAAQESTNLRAFFPASRIETLPLGVDPDMSPDYARAREKLGWAPGERVLLYLSRIHPKKGLKELLEALLSLPEKTFANPCRLVIVGDGPSDYRAVCEERGKALRPRMAIDWVPPRWGSGKWPYVQGADLFCLPTYSENFGIVVLEAGIVGTPVFTTTGTPWKEVEDAGFGWVVEPRPEQYPDVLKRIFARPMAGPRERAAFADWTRAHYGWPELIRRYVDLYRDLVRAGESGRGDA